MKKHLRIWEAALLIALCVTLCYGLSVNAQQGRVSEKLIRLHVVANSDSEYDQGVKLFVRDGVTAYLENRLATAQSARDAEDIIREALPDIENAANAVLSASGCAYRAGATLAAESFPTRVYGSFALPAGEYTSLRVTIGEGAGQNWWCVVFPPLCGGAVESRAAVDALGEDSARFITEDNAEYSVKFRVAEWIAYLKELFGG